MWKTWLICCSPLRRQFCDSDEGGHGGNEVGGVEGSACCFDYIEPVWKTENTNQTSEIIELQIIPK